MRIQCKQVVGSFYPARYVSDAVGLSVQLDKAWYTTKGFQKLIAPKASKFEVNLFVEDLPIEDFLKKRSELQNEEKCEEDLPLKVVNQRGKRRRVPSKRVIRSETEEQTEEKDDEEDKENSGEVLGEKEMSSGRRSGRIAKTASILQVSYISVSLNISPACKLLYNRENNDF